MLSHVLAPYLCFKYDLLLLFVLRERRRERCASLDQLKARSQVFQPGLLCGWVGIQDLPSQPRYQEADLEAQSWWHLNQHCDLGCRSHKWLN